MRQPPQTKFINDNKSTKHAHKKPTYGSLYNGAWGVPWTKAWSSYYKPTNQTGALPPLPCARKSEYSTLKQLSFNKCL